MRTVTKKRLFFLLERRWPFCSLSLWRKTAFSKASVFISDVAKLEIDKCSLNLNTISKADGSEFGSIYWSNVTQIWRQGTRDRKNTKQKPVCVTSKLWRDEQICFISPSQFSHPLFLDSSCASNCDKDEIKKKTVAQRMCLLLIGDDCRMLSLFICLPPAGHAWRTAEPPE